MGTNWGDTYFFLQDYGYLLMDIETKGVLYFDKDKNGWIIKESSSRSFLIQEVSTAPNRQFEKGARLEPS